MSEMLLHEAIKLVVTETLVDRRFYDLLAFTFMSEMSDDEIKDIRYKVRGKGVELQYIDGTDASLEPHELAHYGVRASELGRWLALHGAERI